MTGSRLCGGGSPGRLPESPRSSWLPSATEIRCFPQSAPSRHTTQAPGCWRSATRRAQEHVRATGVPFEQRADYPRVPMAAAVPGTSALAVHSFLAPQPGLAALVHQVAAFRPDIVLYDIFDLGGKVAAHACGVPSAAALVFAGLRALGAEFVAEHEHPSPDIRRANDRMRHDFGIDVLGDAACLPVLFPSRDLSLVTAVEEQSPPCQPGTERLTEIELLLGRALAWTGPWYGGSSRGAETPNFPWKQIRLARLAGRRIVFLSLGTNIMSFRFGHPMGGAPSGVEFVRTASQLAIDAFDGDSRVQLVVATGGYDGPIPGWPAEAVLSPAVPQRQLLADGVDAFITHHGYNSTVEAIAAETPMVAFPGYGDQIANAEFCVAEGLSVARWDLRSPARTCRPGQLRQAVREAADPDRADALRGWRRRLADAGGADVAASLILDLVS